MPRYGDLDALQRTLQRDADLYKGCNDADMKARRDEALNAVACVVNAPTADVVEVRHGRWIPTYHTYYNRDGACQIADEFHCSECGIYSRDEFNYCPNCGAKMDERRNDEV